MSCTTIEKVECLANHFGKVHGQNSEMGVPSHDALVTGTVNEFMQSNLRNDPCMETNLDEVKKVVRSLVNNKAPGFDSIRGLVFKNLSLRALIFYTAIMNSMFRLCYFPTSWKIAKITAICKPGKPSDRPGNYRPVSLLPIPSKVCETIAADRIERVILSKNLVPDAQFGFRRRHSTLHALLDFTECIRNNLRRRETTVAACIDIEKAFDTVWLEGLIYKLITFEFPVEMIKFLHSYLMNRKFRVSIGGITSKEMPVSQGVPEGSVLGPILFVLYLSDIPRVSFTKLNMFADDTTISSSSMYPSVAFSRLQSHLNLLHDYFWKWKMKINADKSECILFTRSRSNFSNLLLEFGGNVINRVDRIKLLGLYVDKKLSYAYHVDKAISKANDISRRLKPLLKRNSGLSIQNKIALYKVFMRSVLTYAITIWNVISVTNFKKVEVFQNKTLRRLWDLRPHPITFRQVPTRTLLDMSDVESVIDFTKRLTKQMYDRMRGHPNSLIDVHSEIEAGRLDERHPFYVIRDEI